MAVNWLFIGSQFSILCWQQLIPPSVPPENHVTPPKSFKLPLWVHHHHHHPPPQPFSFSVQSCELVVADSRGMCELLTHAFWTGSMVTSFVFYSCSQRTLTNWWPLRQITLSTQVMEQGKKTYLVVTWTALSISWKKNEILRPCVYYQFFQKNRSSFCGHTHTRREVWLAVMHLDFQVTFGWLPLRLSITPTDQSPSPLGKTIQLHVTSIHILNYVHLLVFAHGGFLGKANKPFANDGGTRWRVFF